MSNPKNIHDLLTYIKEEEDVVFLRKELFPVNMRLYKSSKRYKEIIQECCDYTKWVVTQSFEGYKNSLNFKLLGISGANLAIPFNIIGVIADRGSKYERVIVMINPKIIKHSLETKIGLESCGSIRESAINVKRYSQVTVEWNDPEFDGIRTVTKFDGISSVIQHEVDHNIGILITDGVDIYY